MKLSKCTHGIIVISHTGEVGMIVGVTNNCSSATLSERQKASNAISLVQWSDGTTTGIHPCNIEPYKD